MSGRPPRSRVALLVDGEEVARGPVGADRAMLTALQTVYRPGELVAIAYRDGAETGRTALVTASGPTALVVTADRTALRADDEDLAFVALELRDAAGVLVTSADVPVTVDVTGAGVLAGLGSGNPKTAERFDAGTRTTFDGRALAVVRPTGAGPIEVAVTAEGFDRATVHLEAAGV